MSSITGIEVAIAADRAGVDAFIGSSRIPDPIEAHRERDLGWIDEVQGR